MQVKKFEARSMNEALEMVKRELGPDAIILSARDHRRKFGLVGDGSVEITAAVAEETLQKKRFAESRMKPETRERFQTSTARKQREIMNDFVDNYREEKAPPRAPTFRRYIEIEDEPNVEADNASARIRDAAQRAWEAMKDESNQAAAKSTAPARGLGAVMRSALSVVPGTAANRIQNAQAAASAQDAAMAQAKDLQSRSASAAGLEIVREAAPLQQNQSEILALKSELESLKTVLRDFQKMPQTFAGTHPGSEYGLSYDFSGSFEKLVQAGIAKGLAAEILQAAQTNLPQVKHKSRGLIDGYAAKYILDTTKVTGATKARIHCFVGPRGSGKTSALVKMASHAVVSGHKKVALITTDNQKVGAVDQMRIFAQILNVPFGVVRKPADWQPLLKQLEGFDMILCDFPGLSMKSIEEMSLMKALVPPTAAEIHLTLSACAKDAELEEVCRRFEATKYNDLIFNHLDEAMVHGSIYNIMRKFERPLHSFGVGPHVPEDFEAASKERVLDLIFRLTKFKKAQQE